MKNIVSTILLSLCYGLPIAYGQVDQARMTKDLRVAAKVLETMWQGEENFVMYNNNVESNYIAGYGVMFTIGGQYSVFFMPSYPVVIDNSAGGRKRAQEVIAEAREEQKKAEIEVTKAKLEVEKAKLEVTRAKMAVERATEATEAAGTAGEATVRQAEAEVRAAEAKVQAAEEKVRAAEKRLEAAAMVSDNTIVVFENNEENKDKVNLTQIMIDFLVDYSQMIGQLKPTDKIVISTKRSDYVYVTDQGGQNPQSTKGTVVEMLKKDHNDYVSGKIDRDELIKRIKVNRSNGEAVRAKDLDLFGSMLKTLYDKDYTESYFITWKPEYQWLKGVGAIYTVKVYSTTYGADGLYIMPATNEQGLTAKERNEKVEQLYPVFLAGMKENMIQYGRTINSLEANEMLILKITMTKCETCTFPQKIQMAVKQSVLSDFNAGKISLKEAMVRVMVSEL